jgi:uncharacterized protein (TIGR03067 family)
MIRYLALLGAVVGGGLVVAQQPSTPPPPDKVAGNDLEKLVGTWNMTSRTRDGKTDDEKTKELKARLIITRDREFRYQTNGKDVSRATFKIEPGTPARITTTSVKGHDELGIYQFKGEDDLELCVAPYGDERPTAFKGEMGNMLLTLKREKEVVKKPGDDKKGPGKETPPKTGDDKKEPGKEIPPKPGDDKKEPKG